MDIGNQEVDNVGPGLREVGKFFNYTPAISSPSPTLYRVSSQMEVLKQVHSSGRDLFINSASRWSNI